MSLSQYFMIIKTVATKDETEFKKKKTERKPTTF